MTLGGRESFEIRTVQVFSRLKVMKMKHDRLMLGMSGDDFP